MPAKCHKIQEYWYFSKRMFVELSLGLYKDSKGIVCI
jgi:hypothetical protein